MARLLEEDWMVTPVREPDREIAAEVQKNWDSIAKPIDGLGVFEKVFCRIGAIQGTGRPRCRKKRLLIFCADNGIVAEGVSQCGQEVTLQVAREMTRDESPVGRMAAIAGVDTFPVDIGINGSHTGISSPEFKVREGTRNFSHESAMTREETVRAIAVGAHLAYLSKEEGYDLLAVGEMGIGNTTTASAVCSALLGLPASEVTGRGAGLDDEGLERKISLIDTAVSKYGLRDREPLTVLQTVGGLDIAGIAGVCIGAALYHIPVVLDGMISLAAALAAERIKRGIKGYLLASHAGREPACEKICRELDLRPVLYADMALGEGTGAVMMMQLIDMAASVFCGGTFRDNGIEPYQRFQ